MSGVSVWAWLAAPSPTISARHAEAAQEMIARFRRPRAGPDITIEIPQQIHTLADRVPPHSAQGLAENVVNGVKTIMVNEALRPAGRVASPGSPC
jgi:hypothetical protein